MYVTTTEFKKNARRYVGISKTEDMHITVDEIVNVLTNPDMKRLERAGPVYGIIPAACGKSERQLRMQRLSNENNM